MSITLSDNQVKRHKRRIRKLTESLADMTRQRDNLLIAIDKARETDSAYSADMCLVSALNYCREISPEARAIEAKEQAGK